MRTIVCKSITADKAYVEIFGTSLESKPTSGIITGSSFTEVDTGDRYLFNETASAWVKQPAQGGDSSEPILVTISNNVASMTSTEIKTAISEGAIVCLRYGNLTMYEIDANPSGQPNAVAFSYNYLNTGVRVSIKEDGSVTTGSLSCGTYSKPSGGIPETDLAQAVRDKLTRGNSDIMQVIPVEYDGSNFIVHLRPMDIDDGYTLTYEQDGETRSATFPAFRDSSYTQIMLYLTGGQWTESMRFAVTPDYSNVDGVTFHTQIVALDGIGLTGYVGVLTIAPNSGYDSNYTATIHYWQDAANVQ